MQNNIYLDTYILICHAMGTVADLGGGTAGPCPPFWNIFL